jgi:site-specific DNA-methyltransferase (adenine-specific)
MNWLRHRQPNTIHGVVTDPPYGFFEYTEEQQKKGRWIVLDPFRGTGSTPAAAEAVGYSSIEIEKDPYYFEIAKKALPRLVQHKNGDLYSVTI